MNHYKTIISTCTISLPGYGSLVYDGTGERNCAGICEVEPSYFEMLRTQKYRISACTEYWMSAFSLEEFERRFQFSHRAICTDDMNLHLIELNALQEEVSHTTIPLTEFPDGFLYVAQGILFEDKTDLIFQRDNLLFDVFPSEEAALTALKEKFTPLIRERVKRKLGTEPSDLSEIRLEQALPSYQFYVRKVSPSRFPAELGHSTHDDLRWYDPQKLDRSDPDRLYRDLMRLVACEVHLYNASFRRMLSAWEISNYGEWCYKSYEDFISNSAPEFSVGDCVYLNDLECTRMEYLLHREKMDGKGYRPSGSYVVVPSRDRTRILDSWDPLMWSKVVRLDGVDSDGQYYFYDWDDIPEYRCTRIPEEEVPEGSFLELTRALTLEDKIVYEGHNKRLEQEYFDLSSVKKIPYTELPAFRAILEKRANKPGTSAAAVDPEKI